MPEAPGSLPKQDRLRLFFDRLSQAPPASTHDEAFELIARILIHVEDEYSGISNEPTLPGKDGRMYPPSPDYIDRNDSQEGLICYRQANHSTYIAANGAILIRTRQRPHTTGEPRIEIDKPGADGKRVFDNDSSP